MLRQTFKSTIKKNLRTIVGKVASCGQRIFVVNQEKIKAIKSNNQFLNYLAIQTIMNSHYWQPEWYLQYYARNLTRYEALSEWYSHYYKNGDNPSLYFDTKFYLETYKPYINPLLHFLLFGRYHYCLPSPRNLLPIDGNKIKTYWKKYDQQKHSSVVYTCIVNDYDSIEAIRAYQYFDPKYDYICFSNNKDLIKKQRVGIWQIKPLQFDKSDPTRINRWHKLHPHKLFPNHQTSIYLDANIDILTPFLFEIIEKRQSQKILVPQHANNNSIFQEFDWAIANKVDDVKRLKQLLKIIKQEQMPINYGATENNVLYRQHHDKQIIALMEEWWTFVEKYSKRDQLSFTYLLYKHRIKVEDIIFPNTRIDINNFYVFDHQKK